MPSNKKYISIKFSEAKLKKRNRELSILLEISNFITKSDSLVSQNSAHPFILRRPRRTIAGRSPSGKIFMGLKRGIKDET